MITGLLLAALLGMGGEKLKMEDLVPPDLRDAVQVVEGFRIWEGLPHPFEGKELAEYERRRADVVRWAGEYFYEEEPAVTAAARAAILEDLGGKNVFRRWRGEKFCGGFHGTWAVGWRTGEGAAEGGGEQVVVVLCFSCHEAKIVRASGTTRVDVEAAAMKRLGPLLRPMAKHVPAAIAGKGSFVPEKRTLPPPEFKFEGGL